MFSPKPRPDLKPKRLAERNRMTAILGMNCNDGILMLADTEETLLGGAAKSECDKLFRFIFPIGKKPIVGGGTVITGGAGDSHLIESANQELKKIFRTAIDPDTEVLDVLNSFATNFFKEMMEPYRDAGAGVYIPEFDMLIAVNIPPQPTRLFCWKKARVLEEFHHASLGTGVTQIHPMLRDVQFYGSCEGMLFHGIRMMYYAKRAVAGVGGKTEAIALQRNGATQYFGTTATQEIEDLVVNLEQFCNGFLYSEISNTYGGSDFHDLIGAFTSYQKKYAEILAGPRPLIKTNEH